MFIYRFSQSQFIENNNVLLLLGVCAIGFYGSPASCQSCITDVGSDTTTADVGATDSTQCKLNLNKHSSNLFYFSTNSIF